MKYIFLKNRKTKGKFIFFPLICSSTARYMVHFTMILNYFTFAWKMKNEFHFFLTAFGNYKRFLFYFQCFRDKDTINECSKSTKSYNSLCKLLLFTGRLSKVHFTQKVTQANVHLALIGLVGWSHCSFY